MELLDGNAAEDIGNKSTPTHKLVNTPDVVPDMSVHPVHKLSVMVPRLVQTVAHVLDQTIVLVDQDLQVQGVQILTSVARVMADVTTAAQIVTVHSDVPVIRDINYKEIRRRVLT